MSDIATFVQGICAQKFRYLTKISGQNQGFENRDQSYFHPKAVEKNRRKFFESNPWKAFDISIFSRNCQSRDDDVGWWSIGKIFLLGAYFHTPEQSIISNTNRLTNRYCVKSLIMAWHKYIQTNNNHHCCCFLVILKSIRRGPSEAQSPSRILECVQKQRKMKWLEMVHTCLQCIHPSNIQFQCCRMYYITKKY